MGFFSDLFEGNFGNLGHDIMADPIAETGLLAGGALLTGGLLAPELAGVAGGLFGAGEAAGTGLATSALGGAALGGAEAGIDIGSLAAGGVAGGADAALSFAPTDTAGLPNEITTGASPGATPTPTTDLASSVSPTGTDQQVSDIMKLVNNPPEQGSSGSIFDKLVTGAENQITKNPLGVAAGGVGLGMSLLGGTKSSGPAQDALKAEAPVLQGQGNTLQSYLASGTLPPALQAQLDQQIAAAKARIVANHAAQGRSTDPSQNSALAQELNNVDLQATALKGQTETQLYQQGLEDIQLSTQLNTTLANFDRQDQQAVTQALANFAKAMSPSSGGIQLKLPG